MSFHLQRLSNKLYRTRHPTTAYDFHYAFTAKRGLAPENWTPTVANAPADELEASSSPSPVEYSNWKLVTKKKSDQNPSKHLYWSHSFLFIVCIIAKGVLSEQGEMTKISGSLSQLKLGENFYQDNLE
jgi:hypothetical protein